LQKKKKSTKTNSLLTALLMIDCQAAFVTGSWAMSFEPEETDTIREAFGRVERFVRERLPGDVVLAMTECPFWSAHDRAIWPPIRDAVLASRGAGVPLFVKPDNDVNEHGDFARWLAEQRGVTQLVIGGCTLNSCVRVSAITTARRVAGRMAVGVDLSLCGARASNHTVPAPWSKNGLTPVADAIAQMKRAGVTIFGDPDSWLLPC
jgi:nicotinamidase-related amidase